MGSVVHGICFHGIGVPRRPLEPGEERYWITADAFHTIMDAIAEIPGIRISFDDGNASDLRSRVAGAARAKARRGRSSSSPAGSGPAAASTRTVCVSSLGTG